ncbi:MAG TPA: peptide chain release factor N(5)-glutamine methyltransferase [Rhizomicrobium sp.]|nr:peptide chain release factor N(5)-glutamine methyltransferase [Rhizomicrobium sp.]
MSDTVERLAAAGVDNPRLDARLLTTEEQIARRIAREPVAYILGHKGFWTLDIRVGPGALIPRPETETLIEEMLKRFPDRAAPLDIVDLGTGSGCLLVTALSEYPNALGTGVDVSDPALEWAARNLAAQDQVSRSRLVQCDFTEIGGTYDVILSNPPYIRTDDIPNLAPEIRLHEPARALAGGTDGLEVCRVLAGEIGRLLKPQGLAFLEIGAGQGPDVAAVMAAKGLKVLGFVPDLAGIPRCAVVGR